jgi:nitroreductase
MELIEALKRRKSARAFSNRTVSKEDVARIIEAGILAPTKGNCQIWEFVVVTGPKKEALDKEMLNLVRTDLIPSMQVSDPVKGEKSEAVRRAERRSGQNKGEISAILNPLGKEFTTFMIEGTFTFFSAPVAILIYIDQAFAKDLPHVLSVGGAVENMLLSATEIGLGTCWLGGVWRYEKTIAEILGLPPGKKLLSSVAVGYSDENSPISAYKSSRDPLPEFVNWIGFDEIH